MLESALGILVSAVVALIIAFPLGSALKKCPWAFYAAALVLVLGYTALRELFPRNDLVQAAMPLFQKGYVSVWLLAVVMWTGVLDEGTALRKRLQPIRGELSILSFIFILAHLIIYLDVYLPRFGALFGTRSNVGVSLVFAMVLAALFLVLTVTSFHAVRNRMSARGWKHLQRFSYVMVVLVFVHVVFVLGRSAFAGGFNASTLSVIVYGAVIVVYAVLRVLKWRRDARRHDAREAAAAEAAG